VFAFGAVRYRLLLDEPLDDVFIAAMIEPRDPVDRSLAERGLTKSQIAG
jgi:hypothetical protein